MSIRPMGPSRAGLAGAYVPKIAGLLAGLPRRADVYSLTPTAPTITGPTLGASTTISGGLLHRPKSLNNAGNATIDVDGDPHYRYLSARQGLLRYGVGFPDFGYVKTDLLTGGTAQDAHWRTTIRSEYSGQVLGVAFKALGTTQSYRLRVDGKRVTETMQQFTGLTSGSEYVFHIDFGSAVPRVIDIDLTFSTQASFGGFWVEPTATHSRGPAPRRSLAVLGDSISGGANSVGVYDTWPARVGNLLGCDEICNLSIGGTGYFAGSGTSDFRTRLPDVYAAAPDVLIVWGGYNDAAISTQAQVRGEAAYVVQQVQANLPKCLIVLVGCWSPGNPTATILATNAGLAQAASDTSVIFIDPLDPLGVAATALAWANATLYRIGDVVSSGGVAWVCVVQHTSSGSLNTANFRATSWVNGTGHVGATAGNGNADVLINSTDVVHPTQLGHQTIERRMIDQVETKFRVLALGGS